MNKKKDNDKNEDTVKRNNDIESNIISLPKQNLPPALYKHLWRHNRGFAWQPFWMTETLLW